MKIYRGQRIEHDIKRLFGSVFVYFCQNDTRDTPLDSFFLGEGLKGFSNTKYVKKYNNVMKGSLASVL